MAQLLLCYGGFAAVWQHRHSDSDWYTIWILLQVEETPQDHRNAIERGKG